MCIPHMVIKLCYCTPEIKSKRKFRAERKNKPNYFEINT